MSIFKPCSDFDLADLTALQRDILKNDDPMHRELNAFILSLSTVFNDLKGMYWFHQQLQNGKPTEFKIDGYCGQWSGISLQVKRLLISLFYELLEAIRRNQKSINHPFFLEALEKSPEFSKEAWVKLIKINSGRTKKIGPECLIIGLIKKIRNDITFHYYTPENFYSGYEYWLTLRNISSQFAYVSLGKNMEQTRFYFADAACEQYLERAVKDQGLTENQIFDYIRLINNALRGIIEEYLKNEAIRKNNAG